MVHFKYFYSINSFATINMYHFINLKIVYHSNRAVRQFVFVRFRMNRNVETVTVSVQRIRSDAGDDHRDVMALLLLSHGDLQVTSFPAIPHMPHEMAWFNVSSGTSAAL